MIEFEECKIISIERLRADAFFIPLGKDNKPVGTFAEAVDWRCNLQMSKFVEKTVPDKKFKTFMLHIRKGLGAKYLIALKTEQDKFLKKTVEISKNMKFKRVMVVLPLQTKPEEIKENKNLQLKLIFVPQD